MSRCLLISVPEDRGDDVIRVLQDDCHLHNVVRTTQDGTSTIRCCLNASTAGFVVHNLDKIGVGVAFGEVAMLTVPVLLPLQRNTRLREMVKQAGESLAPSQRLAVEEIYASVFGGATLSFEYFALIVCAAIIAGVGLATNNSVMIVASMLVSPLMGPILGFTLAAKLRDWRLFQQAILVEACGMLTTFLVGFITGLFAAISDVIPSVYSWPTDEMSSRGDVKTLITGAVYAVPSGVAVALASANPNFGALVGVAIAASLLPPITNSGLCFGFAAASNNSDDHEYARIAGYSLTLFAINVGLIFLSCYITLWIKGISRMTRRQLSTYKPLPVVPVVPSGKPGVEVIVRDGSQQRSQAALKWQSAVEKTQNNCANGDSKLSQDADGRASPSDTSAEDSREDSYGETPPVGNGESKQLES